MQNRLYAIAILVILGICCLGVYVAVSGFFNKPATLNPNSSITPAAPDTAVVIVIPTDTPVPKPGTSTTVTPTIALVPSPLGALQTAVAPVSPTTTPKPAVPPTAAPAPTTPAQACGDFRFCPSGGPPDTSISPGGAECPRNYIWGRVVDLNLKGIPDWKIRYKTPSGETDSTTTKGPPDPPGKYDIPSVQSGSTWTIWLVDPNGSQASPQFTITAQVYTGAGNCPTRVDFVQKR